MILENVVLQIKEIEEKKFRSKMVDSDRQIDSSYDMNYS